MRDRDYGWTAEMQAKAARLGVRCVEVPVSYHRRIGQLQDYRHRQRNGDGRLQDSHHHRPGASFAGAARSGRRVNRRAMRKTKIVATLGPATSSPEMIERLIARRHGRRPDELLARHSGGAPGADHASCATSAPSSDAPSPAFRIFRAQDSHRSDRRVERRRARERRHGS